MENQVQGCQALLAIDQLPLAVGHRLHHDRLQVVSATLALIYVDEKVIDLVGTPPIAALISRDIELSGNLADGYLL
jgi:hypothetical protein